MKRFCLKLRGRIVFLAAACILAATASVFAQDAAPVSANATVASVVTPDSEPYVKKAWSLSGKAVYDEALKTADEGIVLFEAQAAALSRTLSAFPPKEEISKYKVMNDVASLYFIKGETLRDKAEIAFDKSEAEAASKEAIALLRELIKKYPYAQNFDPRGWYWSLAEKAKTIILEIEKGPVCEETPNPRVEPTHIVLYDEGSEFPVDYAKYGEFVNVGEKGYRYQVKDPIGLGKAVGEGVYPNSTSVKFDPAFIAVKKSLPGVKHWDVLNGRDLNLAFYKWNVAPENDGVRQFYLADILERAGLIKQAIKAYYAVLVHFPNICAWTYWHTPWYPGKAALYRIKFLLEHNPALDVTLEGATMEIVNGYDNDISNDIFLVNPGRLVKTSLLGKINRRAGNEKKPGSEVAAKIQGTGRVKLVQYKDGDWQLLVNGEPFVIHGITYTPARVGESPDKNTLANWTTQDLNHNGLVDGPYEAWVDENYNNAQDPEEKAVGDFKLLKDMGANCLRIYHHPAKPDKKLLGQMYEKYGIYVAMGDYLGKYTNGSKADWSRGTDYDNPDDRQNMLTSVKEMVEEYKDEPYVLIWILGNENVYGLGCNADKKPESFFKFANDAAFLIKSLDPMKRPVMIASGDTLFLNVFAKDCPDIDIFGANLYRGRHGFLDFWDDVKRVTGKPAAVTEYGAPAYGEGYSLKEAEDYQADYHEAAWEDISGNAWGKSAGNALGGFLFEWLDEWWKAYNPRCHDVARLSAGPFLDGYYREEWFGICAQGDGSHSPFMRQLRKAYFVYKKLWNTN